MYESTKGAPHQKNYTKLSLPSVSLEKFSFQSICLQALIVHGDEVTKYRSSSRFPQNLAFSDGQQEFMSLGTLAKSGVRVS